jgi:hypothetical protein
MHKYYAAVRADSKTLSNADAMQKNAPCAPLSLLPNALDGKEAPYSYTLNAGRDKRAEPT